MPLLRALKLRAKRCLQLRKGDKALPEIIFEPAHQALAIREKKRG
jgi:hypothetical protein